MADELQELRQSLADRYEIDSLIGTGGMARVYLATDVRHGRKVAVKVLRRMVAAAIGAERFLKEIQLTASLQHPGILPLFDSGRATVAGEGSREFLYYVMPFIEGETLRQKLTRENQLGVDEALQITREVADALEYAHRHNVIHRDIKPENILLNDGRAMVADFGTALAISSAGSQRLTETGVSLGTPDYMSPEQATADRELDARSDIYSLAAVLYEMLAGKSPHAGSNTQAIVAAVVTRDPAPIMEQRSAVPPSVAEAIHRALAKVPADRFPSMRAFVDALKVSRLSTGTYAVMAKSRSWVRDPRSIGLLVVAVLAVALGFFMSGAPRQELPPIRRAEIPLRSVFDARAAEMSISADGSTLVINAGSAGLSLHRLNQADPQIISGTEGLSDVPFLNSDGSRLGYMRGPDLVVLNSDGTNRRSYDFPGRARSGAAFLGDHEVVIVTSDGLAVFDLDDGSVRPVSPVIPGLQFLEPHVLPGGRAVIVTGTLGATAAYAMMVDLRSGAVDTLMPQALSAQYADGWLYFARPSGALHAVEFDPRSGEVGGAVVELGDVAMMGRNWTASFAVGAGVVAYGKRLHGHLVALSESGQRQVLTAEEGLYHSPRVSPDGSLLTFDLDQGGLTGRDVWLLDLTSGGQSRVTNVGDAHDPTWTPDGRGITYLSYSSTDGSIFTVPANGSEGRSIVFDAVGKTLNPGEWLPSGDGYLGGLPDEDITSDIVVFRPDRARIDSLVATPFDEHSPAVSRDGTLLAYTSNESGLRQVFVRSLNGTSGRVLVSIGAGEEARWSADGSELFYVEHGAQQSELKAAMIAAGSPPTVGRRRTVISPLNYEPVGNHANWDVLPDGRFVVSQANNTGWNVGVVFNWRPVNGATRAP